MIGDAALMKVSYEIIIKRWLHSQPKVSTRCSKWLLNPIMMTPAISYVIINPGKLNYPQYSLGAIYIA